MRKTKIKILLLGGTRQARQLARLLGEKGYEVIYSLAGVTQEPVLPQAKLRIGGFGGVDGLVNYVRENAIAAIADATHPFATNITQNAFAAAKRAGIGYVRLEPRRWKPLAGERWSLVGDVEAAVRAVGKDGRVFVAIGRKELAKFAVRSDLSVLARSIEVPDMEVPENWKFVQARPPFSREEEKALLAGNQIDTLVCKNSGGKAGASKLAAARELGVRVIMIERPALPGIKTVHKAEQVLAFLPRPQSAAKTAKTAKP